MKKYKISTLAILAGIILLVSCNNYLKTQLMNQKTSSTYYQTPSDAMTALTGCYNGLDLIWNAGIAFPVASEIFSDNCLGGTGASDNMSYQILDAQNNKIMSINDMFLSNWQAYYQAIYRCNVLIQNEGNVDWASDSATLTKSKCDGEAKFLRAYLYYDMVRLWGNIPLLTAPSSDNLPQANPDSVYAQIISDLKDAASELPAISVTTQPYTGRATKWAAEAMLARVFLFYTGYYGKTDCAGFTKANALAAVEDVIANSGHRLESNFVSLWPAACVQDSITGSPVVYAGENNSEVVFSIKYTYANSNYNGGVNGNGWLVMMGMRDETHYPFYMGWGACTVDPKLYNAYDANDQRRFASIINVATEVPAFGTSGTGISDQREYTGYYNKKYTPMCDANGNSLAVNAGGTNFMISQYQDYFVMRYADVLLMAAELGSSNAESYFNQVHTRAGLSPIGAAPTETQILNERRFEFAFEGIRYWDLLRQGINTAASTIIANTSTNLLQDGTSNAAANFTAQNFILTKGFQQIPQTQITLSNGVLKQNAGW